MTAHNSIHSQIKGLYTCYDVSLQAIYKYSDLKKNYYMKDNV